MVTYQRHAPILSHFDGKKAKAFGLILNLFLLLAILNDRSRADESETTPLNCSIVCQREFESRRHPSAETTKSIEGALLFDTSTNNSTVEQLIQKAIKAQNAVQERLDLDDDNKKQLELFHTLNEDPKMETDVVTAILKSLSDILIDQDMKQLESEKEGVTTDILLAQLENLREINSPKIGELEEKIKDADPNDPLLISDLFDGTDLARKLGSAGLAAISYVKCDLVRDAVLRLKSGQAITEAEINEAIRKWDQISTTAEQIAKDTSERIKKLNSANENLTSAIEILAKGEVQTSYRLDAVEGAIWEHMTPKEQLKALQAGDFDSILAKQDDEAAFRRHVELAAEVQDIRETTATVVSTAHDLQNIGHAIGMDTRALDADVATIDKGAQIIDAVLSFASPSPLSIIHGLGGLAGALGPGQSDSTASALSALRLEMTRMRQDMLRFHNEEMAALQSISQRMESHFDTVVHLQNSLLDQVGFVTLQANELLTNELNACQTLVNAWRENSLLPSPGHLNAESFDAKANRINGTIRDSLVSCGRGIHSSFFKLDENGRTNVSTIFSEQSLPGDAPPEGVTQTIQEVQRYRDFVLRPTVEYTFRTLKYGKANCRDEDIIFLSLIETASRDNQLTSAAADIANACESQPKSYLTVNGAGLDPRSLLDQPLSIVNIASYSRTAYDAAAIYEYVGDVGSDHARVLSLSELSNSPEFRMQWPEVSLRGVLDIVNIGIAQLNAISGDLILDRIADDIEEGLSANVMNSLPGVDPSSWAGCDARDTDMSDPAVRKRHIPNEEYFNERQHYFNAVCLLSHNDLLRYNFTLHWIRRSFNHWITSARYNYAVGLNMPSEAYLDAAFKVKLPLDHTDGSWKLSLPRPYTLEEEKDLQTSLSDDKRNSLTQIKLDLPDWPDVAVDFRPMPIAGAAELFRLRSDIVQRVAEYDLSRNLNPLELQIANRAVQIASHLDGQ